MVRTRGSYGIVKPAESFENLDSPVQKPRKKARPKQNVAISTTDTTPSRKQARKAQGNSEKTKRPLLTLKPPNKTHDFSREQVETPDISLDNNALGLPDRDTGTSPRDKTVLSGKDLSSLNPDSIYAPTRPPSTSRTESLVGTYVDNIRNEPDDVTRKATRNDGGASKKVIKKGLPPTKSTYQKVGSPEAEGSSNPRRKAGKPKDAGIKTDGRKAGQRSGTRNHASNFRADGSWSPPAFAPDHLLVPVSDREMRRRRYNRSPVSPNSQQPVAIKTKDLESKRKAQPSPTNMVLRSPTTPTYELITPPYNSVRHTPLPPRSSANRVVKTGSDKRRSSAPPPCTSNIMPSILGRQAQGTPRARSADGRLLRAWDPGHERDSEGSSRWEQRMQDAFIAVVLQLRNKKRSQRAKPKSKKQPQPKKTST